MPHLQDYCQRINHSLCPAARTPGCPRHSRSCCRRPQQLAQHAQLFQRQIATASSSNQVRQQLPAKEADKWVR